MACDVQTRHEQPTFLKQGRNAPCVCGSKEKAKRCCGERVWRCGNQHDLEPRPHGEEWNDGTHGGLPSDVVRHRFPRRVCRRPGCRTICYDSEVHYYSGIDW